MFKRIALTVTASLLMASPALAHNGHGDDCPDKQNGGKSFQIVLSAGNGSGHDNGDHGSDCGH